MDPSGFTSGARDELKDQKWGKDKAVDTALVSRLFDVCVQCVHTHSRSHLRYFVIVASL